MRNAILTAIASCAIASTVLAVALLATILVIAPIARRNLAFRRSVTTAALGYKKPKSRRTKAHAIADVRPLRHHDRTPKNERDGKSSTAITNVGSGSSSSRRCWVAYVDSLKSKSARKTLQAIDDVFQKRGIMCYTVPSEERMNFTSREEVWKLIQAHEADTLRGKSKSGNSARAWLVSKIRHFCLATMEGGAVDAYIAESSGELIGLSATVVKGDTLRGMWFYVHPNHKRSCVWFYAMRLQIIRAAHDPTIRWVDLGPAGKEEACQMKRRYGFDVTHDWQELCNYNSGPLRSVPSSLDAENIQIQREEK